MRLLSCLVIVFLMTTVTSSLFDKLGKLSQGDLLKTKFDKKDLDDIFDKGAFNKFDDIFKGGKSNEFIDNLKNIGEKTKKSLKLSTDLRQKLKSNETQHFNKFFGFIAKFDKEYQNNTHVEDRFKKFQESLKRIDLRQQNSSLAKFGITKFSDLTPEEFIAKHTGVKGVDHLKKLHGDIDNSTLARSKRDTTSIPCNFDWRDHNGVTPIQNQASCGCCYAFAAVGIVESQHLINTGQTLHLSEQQAVSCTYQVAKYNNNGGCNGGTSDGVLGYIIDNGITTADNFVYTSGANTQVPSCQTGKPYATKVSSQAFLPSNDEDNIAAVVYETGPTVTYVDASSFQDFNGGILDTPEPSGGWGINHAVIIVGYGEDSGTKYWNIKNSWGEDWGDAGYLKIKRGDNALDMAQYNFAAYF